MVDFKISVLGKILVGIAMAVILVAVGAMPVIILYFSYLIDTLSTFGL